MRFFLPAILVLFVAACNSGPGNSANTTGQTAVWDSANRYNFIQACMEEQKAQVQVNDTILYSYCKCMLDQMEKRYPNPDSVKVIDSATLRQMQLLCTPQ